MSQQFYAHSLENQPPDKWQPLEEHLQNVSALAAGFAYPFGGDQWARLAGLWHDLGKYSQAFQAKILIENGFESHLTTHPGRVVHSEAGGHLAIQKNWPRGADRVLSWLIMGHHSGLADYQPDKTGAKALEPKMREPNKSKEILNNVPAGIAEQKIPNQPIPQGAEPSFFIRMLYSCVVDADFLDTEAFMNRTKATIRCAESPSLDELLPMFDRYMNQLCAEARPTSVNKIRALVLEQCRIAAEKEPSVFSLTVPTGGGKTLSSLAFALRHAVIHKKTRIVYVIPYTSIIEQTAGVFRDIPGFEKAVLEHHCNVVHDDESEEESRSRLATENWDAPIIVTTAVQFFESLYACRSSRCRKLHNIVNSVVIFDEAQCLPPEYLRPCVFSIRELFRFYSVTPVLCTATQPVLTKTEQFDFNFKEGFDSVVEIMDDPEDFAEQLKRVDIELFSGVLNPVDYQELAQAIIAENQSTLCIVNRKDDCRELARLLPKEQTIHLSTNMCAEHRFQTLKKIRQQLKSYEKTIYVISTSLVEAGVDLDFPVVYRALTGLDSIAQAAGRCNREGILNENGKTVVFVPEKQPRYVQQPAGIASELLNGDLSNLFSPEKYKEYFSQRFWQLGTDALDYYGILQLLSERMNYYFRTAAEKFRFIKDDWQTPVIVPFGDSQELIDRMVTEPWRDHYYMRKLQRFTINIETRLYNKLVEQDYIYEVKKFPDLFTLISVLYDDQFGFLPPDEITGYDPENTII